MLASRSWGFLDAVGEVPSWGFVGRERSFCLRAEDPLPLRGCPPTSQEDCKIGVFSVFPNVFESSKVL
jgi:hypothetical protein